MYYSITVQCKTSIERLRKAVSLSLSLSLQDPLFPTWAGWLARQAKHSDSRLGRLAHSSLCLLCSEALQTE